MDWKLKLMQVLECVGSNEDVWFEYDWALYGITEAEAQVIKEEYKKYEAEKK